MSWPRNVSPPTVLKSPGDAERAAREYTDKAVEGMLQRIGMLEAECMALRSILAEHLTVDHNRGNRMRGPG